MSRQSRRTFADYQVIYREEGCSQGPTLRLEPRRVWATDPGIVTCRTRIRRRRLLGSEKRDGARSSCMGVAHHGEGAVLGSMLGLGRTIGRSVGLNGQAAHTEDRHHSLQVIGQNVEAHHSLLTGENTSVGLCST
jgi:hypothetical protein